MTPPQPGYSGVVEFSISGIAAEHAKIQQILPARSADSGRAGAETGSPFPPRFGHRFTRRVSSGGRDYRCEITASCSIAVVLIGRLHEVARRANADGNAELAMACATALAAITAALDTGIGPAVR